MRTDTILPCSISLEKYVSGFVTLMLIAQLSAFAQVVEVTIDHARGKVTIKNGGTVKTEMGKDFTITSNDPVSVMITNTNSALFDIVTTTERKENGTATAVKSFLDKSKPYLIDLGSAALNALAPVAKSVFGFGATTYTLSDSIKLLYEGLTQKVLPEGTSVSQSLQHLNELLFYSPSSIRVIELKAMETLRHLEPSNREQFERERNVFKDHLLSGHAFEDTSFSRYTVSDSLIACWETLNTSSGMLQLQTAKTLDLQQTLLYTLQTETQASLRARLRPNSMNVDSLVKELKKIDQWLTNETKLITEASRALDEKGANLTAASEIEKIARATALAIREKKLATTKPDFENDQVVHVTISQSDVSVWASFPEQTDVQYNFTIQSDPGFRATLGLGLAGWFGSGFSDFAAIQTGASQYQIMRKAPDASRFRYVATLGILFRKIDGIIQNNTALWFPEITIGPANDLEGLGIGAAYAFGKVKIGLGALWIKHVELDGQLENQFIPSASALRTRKTYGRFWSDPRIYLSIAVFDIPPFIITK
jgi:hypothetical protein